MESKNIPSHHGIKVEEEDCSYLNETMKLLIKRGSCRNFSEQKIEPEIMELIFKAGCHGATGGNLQPYSIIKIEDEKMRLAIGKNMEQEFIRKAPVHLLFCLDWNRIKRWAELEIAPFSANSSFRHYWISFQDVIICAQNICIAAESFGVSSVYIGTTIEIINWLETTLELPKGVFPVVLLAIGYPKTKPSSRKKLPPSVIVHNEKYQIMKDEEIVAVFNKKYENQKIEITDERIKKIEKVCADVHGKDYAKKCVEKIKKTGYITPVQRQFGLHYTANEMAKGNKELLELFKEAGFFWFQE